MTQPPEEVMPLLGAGGPSAFVTLNNVAAAPNAVGDTVVFTVETDQLVQLRFTVWDAQNPSVTAAGTESTAKVGMRTFSYPLAPLTATPQGRVLGYEITSITAPPPTLRPYQGTVRIPGARTVGNGKALPVRFYSFSGPMDGAVPALGQKGNWSTYTWSQWNSKGT